MKQSAISDCGASCLYMILKYHDGFETLENLKKLTHTDKFGTSLYNLKEAATSLGFEATGLEITLEEIKKNKFEPFIAHTLIDDSFFHYIVVYKIKGKKLWITDPSEGYIKVISEETFNSIFTNKILVLYPRKPLIRNKNHKTFSQWFISLLNKNKKLLCKIALLSFLITLLEIINISSLYIYSQISKSNNIHLLIIFSIVFITVILIKNSLDIKRKNNIIKFEFDTNLYLKNNFWTNILNLPYRDLEKKNSGENLIKIEEVEKQNLFILESVTFFFFDLLTFICIIIFFIFYKKMFIYFIIYCLLELIIEFYLTKKEKNVILDLKKLESNEKQKSMEVLESIIGIKETNLEKNIIYSLKEHNEILENKKLKSQKSLFKYYFIHNTLNQTYLIYIYTLITYNVIKGIMFLEDFLIISYLFSLTNNFFKTLLELIIQKEEIKWIIEGMDNLNEIKKEEQKINSIEFRQSKFLERGNLKNISLVLKKNNPTLLLGKSGIGKSTLALLVKGYYSLNNRYINNELKEILDISYQEKVLYISTNNYIYTDTLMENILLKRNIETKKLNDILKITHVDKIIEKNPKLFLFENGINLSSGEKQKIALARFLLNDFDVLILDEALNKIDEIEEKKIMEELLNYFNDKIILVITHRTNIKNLFSKIVILTNHGQLKKIKRKEITCLEKYLEQCLES